MVLYHTVTIARGVSFVRVLSQHRKRKYVGKSQVFGTHLSRLGKLLFINRQMRGEFTSLYQISGLQL